jgi:hypothetical protein
MLALELLSDFIERIGKRRRREHGERRGFLGGGGGRRLGVATRPSMMKAVSWLLSSSDHHFGGLDHRQHIVVDRDQAPAEERVITETSS